MSVKKERKKLGSRYRAFQYQLCRYRRSCVPNDLPYPLILRVHIDPAQDGAEVVNLVCDRVRAELLRRIGLEDVLTPARLV